MLFQELIGQNSNDSSSGGGVSGTPGTPNSQQQVMRPTPSPTGSAGSRSLSPAIGTYLHFLFISLFYVISYKV